MTNLVEVERGRTGEPSNTDGLVMGKKQNIG